MSPSPQDDGFGYGIEELAPIQVLVVDEAIKTILSDGVVQQTKEVGLVEAEHAYLAYSDEQEINQKYAIGDAFSFLKPASLAMRPSWNLPLRENNSRETASLSSKSLDNSPKLCNFAFITVSFLGVGNFSFFLCYAVGKDVVA